MPDSGPRTTLRYRPGDHVTCHNNGSRHSSPSRRRRLRERLSFPTGDLTGGDDE